MKKIILILILFIGFNSYSQIQPSNDTSKFKKGIGLPNSTEDNTPDKIPVMDSDGDINKWITPNNFFNLNPFELKSYSGLGIEGVSLTTWTTNNTNSTTDLFNFDTDNAQLFWFDRGSSNWERLANYSDISVKALQSSTAPTLGSWPEFGINQQRSFWFDTSGSEHALWFYDWGLPDWIQLAKFSDIPTTTELDNTYVKKSGDLMTGNLQFNTDLKIFLETDDYGSFLMNTSPSFPSNNTFEDFGAGNIYSNKIGKHHFKDGQGYGSYGDLFYNESFLKQQSSDLYYTKISPSTASQVNNIQYQNGSGMVAFTSDIPTTATLNADYVNETGDTMTGNLSMDNANILVTNDVANGDAYTAYIADDQGESFSLGTSNDDGKFFIANGFGNQNSRMTITPDGQTYFSQGVGIGMQPQSISQYNLSVGGNHYTTGNIDINSFSTTNNGFNKIVDYSGTGGWARSYGTFSNSQSASEPMKFGLLGNGTNYSYSHLGFGNYNSNKNIKISYNGDLGVGLTGTPSSAFKLSVNGNSNLIGNVNTENIFLNLGSDDFAGIETDGGDAFLYNDQNGFMYFGDNSLIYNGSGWELNTGVDLDIKQNSIKMASGVWLEHDQYGGETGLFDMDEDKNIAVKNYQTDNYEYGGDPGNGAITIYGSSDDVQIKNQLFMNVDKKIVLDADEDGFSYIMADSNNGTSLYSGAGEGHHFKDGDSGGYDYVQADSYRDAAVTQNNSLQQAKLVWNSSNKTFEKSYNYSWTNLTYNSSNTDGTKSTVQAKIQNDRVIVHGQLNAISDGWKLVAYLPISQMEPARTRHHVVNTTGTSFTKLAINDKGELWMEIKNGTEYSIDFEYTPKTD